MIDHGWRGILGSLLVVALAGTSRPAAAQLVINEVCPRNQSVLEDEHGRYPDWIELHNTGGLAEQLDQYYLSDRPHQRDKWRLPPVVLDPGHYVLFLEGDTTLGEFHFPFGLSASGEAVYLSGPDLQPVHTLVFPAMQADHSFGLAGGTGRVFAEPTPGAPNTSTAYSGYADIPVPDLQPGFVPAGTVLHLHTEPGATIHMTMDGRDPGQASPGYAGSLGIPHSMVVKAIATAPGKLPSTPFVGSYLVGRQPALPVLSLSTHPDSLWHEELGILVTGPNADSVFPYWGANYWERRHLPTHVEYFDEHGRLGLVQRVDLRTNGGSQARTKPQIPLRLTARARYGASRIEYPFFPERGSRDRYKRLVLRNSGGDFCLSNFRDGSWHQIALHNGLDIDVLAFQPIAVYLNGQYHGWMNLRERFSATDLADTYGIAAEPILLMRQENEALQGDTLPFHELHTFITSHDMADPVHWQFVQEHVDLASFMDYVALQMFAGNLDWPANNVRYWKPSVNEGKWRYLLHDLDATMAVFGWITMDVDMFSYVLDHRGWTRLSRMYAAFLENPEFKRRWLNRLADLMNTALSPHGIKAEHDRIIAQVAAEVPYHYARWSCNVDDFPGHTGLMSTFADVRGDHLRQHALQRFGLPNTVDLHIAVYPPAAGQVTLNTIIPETPFQGTYFNGNAIDLAVEAAEGYRFVEWTYDQEPDEAHPGPTWSRAFPEDGKLTAWFVREGEVMTAFPNPFRNAVNIGTTTGRGPVLTRVFDTLGAVVAQHAWTASATVGSTTLSLGHLVPGTYLIECTGTQGRAVTRVVKMP